MAGLQTPLCRELGIEHPIFSVGFSVSAGPELVAAVSNAGGCGVLGGGGGAMPSDELRRRIRRVRELTQAPFGLNFIIAGLEDPDAPEEDRAILHAELRSQWGSVSLSWCSSGAMRPRSSTGRTGAGSRCFSRSAR